MSFKSVFVGISLSLALVAATLMTWLYSQIDSSLPKLAGKQTLFGLTNAALIERDEQGIATINANSRVDLAVATGYLHAQERFFQMDLNRKNSAGELASLFGEIAVDYDKSIRRHRFRERARAIINELPETQLAILKAYTQGVNQGLKSLNAVPFEYLILQQDPVEWQEEDTLLTVFSMYIDLQYADGARELTLGLIHSTFGEQVYQFLNPKGSMWDAPLDNATFTPSAMPTDKWPIENKASKPQKTTSSNLVSVTNPLALPEGLYQSESFPGSNNWAVAGTISQTGSAIVANDMHLTIRVPNTWFRARFKYSTEQNNEVDITGLTLPGTPNMITGSNGNIAWGFTNSYGDYSDVIILETNADNSQYLTPNGYKAFNHHKQIIAIKDQPSQEIEVTETMWGPVIGRNSDGELLAYRWVAHDKEAVNLSQIGLETAVSVKEAFNIATQSGIPAQNLMVGDKQGNIGWTIMGPIPKKQGSVGELPSRWGKGNNLWQGYLSPDQYPQVYNSKEHRLWTANSRVVGSDMLKKLGNGGYALGARSSQIKQRLFDKSYFNESNLLAIALDDSALFLQRWQRLLVERVLSEQTTKDYPLWRESKTYLEQDNLSASADSIAYRIVRNFRINVRDNVFREMNKILTAKSDHYSFHTIRHQAETPLWQLVTQQPDNFSLGEFSSWQQLLERSLEKTLNDMTHDQHLSAASWGQQNRQQIQHPLSKAVPLIGYWLDMPATELPGDSYMPRVQGTNFGASERMIVSPGHESRGILHMPTSQSGHPWSPFYGVGHREWEEGRPSAFLPGPTKYKLKLLSY